MRDGHRRPPSVVIGLNVVESSTKYAHVYCMRPAHFTSSGNGSALCNQDLKFITGITEVSTNSVGRLLSILRQSESPGILIQNETLLRSKHSVGNILLATVLAGGAGAIAAKLTSYDTQVEELIASAERTDEMLKSLGERTNLLYINQRRMIILVEETQQRMESIMVE